MKAISRRATGLLKVAASLGILAWLAHSIDLVRLAAVVRAGSPWPIACGCVLLTLAIVLQALRLRVLAPTLIGGAEALEVTLVGHFVNQLLPSGFGGDGYRALRLRHGPGGWTAALTLVGVDRSLGSLVLGVPGMAVAIAIGLERPGFKASIDTSLEVFREYRFVPLAVVSLLVLLAWLASMQLRRSSRVRSFLGRIIATLRELAPGRYVAVAGLAVMYHLIRLAAFQLLLNAFGWTVAWMQLLAVLFAALIAGLVPVGLGALGIRESAITGGLALFGVPPPVGLAVALVNRGVLWVAAACGALALHRTQRIL